VLNDVKLFYIVIYEKRPDGLTLASISTLVIILTRPAKSLSNLVDTKVIGLKLFLTSKY
jgi:hypothetical protein